MKIFAKAEDEGQSGAKVTVYADRPPKVCPGLGGWKKGPGISYWTRIKGEPASKICSALRGVQNPYVGLQVAESGEIQAISQIGGYDVMDDDLVRAEEDGALVWRKL